MYIFTWNPKKFNWIEYGKENPVVWSSASRKPQPGDKFIFLLQGMKKENGIIGFGKIIRYEMSIERRCHYYLLDFSKLWDFTKEEYPKTDILKNIFPKQFWSPQSSGISVKEEYREKLWKLLNGF